MLSSRCLSSTRSALLVAAAAFFVGVGTAVAQDKPATPEPMAGALDHQPIRREAASLQPAEFVNVTGDNLTRAGEVLRYWGAQGNLMAPTHRDIDHEVSILKSQGYNLHRFASHPMPPITLPDGRTVGKTFTPGDNSGADRFYYLAAACGAADIDMWMVALGRPNFAQLADKSLIDDPATVDAWSAAAAELFDPGAKRKPDVRNIAVIDPRLGAAWKAHIRATLNAVNPYTGLRLADDPHAAVWEISNEQWFVARILWGNHLEWPRYFQDQLQKKWNDWLIGQYGDEAGLRQAWGGLLDGESLVEGKVLMVPLTDRKSISADVVAYGVGVRLTPSQINGDDLPPARGRDVRRFLSEILTEFKTDLIATARGEGKPGIGISVVPIVADTEFNGSTCSLWQNMAGSATTPSLYHDLSGGDPSDPRFPWYSGLNGTPVFNDWFDDKRVRGRPTLMYEGMLWMPQKYRAEFAWRLAAQAAVQNYSVIDFHYYGHPLPAGSTDLTALQTQALATVSTSRLPDGLIYRMDPILTATMHAAGEVFSRGYLKPAPEPVTLVLGRKSLEAFDNSKGSDEAIRATAYRKGFQYDFDPSSEDDRVEGKLVDPGSAPKTFSPTPGLTYDTRNGRMIIDVPQAKAIVGFLDTEHTFAGDVSVRDVQIVNPPDMPFVIDGERYAAISLVSLDGQNLEDSADVLVTAANTAWNTGFKFDADKRGAELNAAMKFAQSVIYRGKAPLIEGRVGCVFEADWLKGRAAIFTDRFGREIGRETLSGGRLVWDADKPIYEIRIRSGS